MTLLAPYVKTKFLGSGGSMVARLKLKGIDGRAPPGVNCSSASGFCEEPASGLGLPSRGSPACNTFKLLGHPVKLLVPPCTGNIAWHRMETCGYGDNPTDRGNEQPSSKCLTAYECSSQTKWRWAEQVHTQHAPTSITCRHCVYMIVWLKI